MEHKNTTAGAGHGMTDDEYKRRMIFCLNHGLYCFEYHRRHPPEKRRIAIGDKEAD